MAVLAQKIWGGGRPPCPNIEVRTVIAHLKNNSNVKALRGAVTSDFSDLMILIHCLDVTVAMYTISCYGKKTEGAAKKNRGAAEKSGGAGAPPCPDVEPPLTVDPSSYY